MKKMVEADSICYEKFELNGEQCWGTGALIDPETVPEGLYCYDLFSVGGVGEWNENEVFVAGEKMKGELYGTILSLKPLDFQEKTEISLKSIKRLDDECLKALDKILEQEGIITDQEEMRSEYQGMQMNI